MKNELSKNLILTASKKCPFVMTCVNAGLPNPISKFKELINLCPYMTSKLASEEKIEYEEMFKKKVEEKKENNTYRVFSRIGRLADKFTTAENFSTEKNILENSGKKLVSVWCSNDYLGMSRHPQVIQEAKHALEKYGVGSGGTRNISGNNILHEKLEATVANWYAKEAGLLFTSCYVANSTTLATLGKLLPNCVLFSDKGNHASMIEGIRNSRCTKIIYKHNDVYDLEEKLSTCDPKLPKIIAFESINSMNGSISNIPYICKLAKKYNALTFVDEVHAVGLYSKNGSGLCAELDCLDQVDIISGTLGKAVGSIGGFIVGKKYLIDMIRSYAPGLIFTTSLPPSVVSAAIASINILKSEEGSKLRQKHQEICSLVRKNITQLGIPLFPSLSHIIPVFVGDSSLCSKLGKRMLDRYNIYVQPINYPTVSFGTERLRIAPTPGHNLDDIYDLLEALWLSWNELGLKTLHPKCDKNCDCIYKCVMHKEEGSIPCRI